MKLQQRTRHLCETLKLLSLVAVALLHMVFAEIAFAQTQEVDNSERYISIQMDRVPGAKFYEVEIAPFETRGLEPGFIYRIFDEEPKVYTRLKPGRYGARTRSLGSDNTPGTWGQWFAFDVEPKKLDVLYPADGAKISPVAKDKEKIVFHWPQISGAKNYNFMLKQDGKVLDIHQSATNWTEAEVTPKGKYEWSVVPEAGAPQGAPVYHFETLEAPQDGRMVIIDVEGDPQATLYQYELVKFTNDNRPGSPSIIESQESRFKMRLPPGLYELRVRSVLPTQGVSDWSRPERFYVKLPYPKMIAPENQITIEPVDNWHNPVELKWEPVAAANKYFVRILDKATKNVVAIREVNTTYVMADLEHEKEYLWSVVALSYGEKPEESLLQSAPSRTFTIGTYIKLLLANPEESSHYYGWYRHWISNIHYVGRNYDQNSLYNQQIFGGTGEFAFGHWNKDSRWGFLVDASLSGFLIENEYYNYMATGLTLGRRVLLSDTTRLRYWFGVSYTEFPDFVVSPYDRTSIHYQRVKTYGPQAQISYLGELSEDYGYHVYFHLYYPLGATHTPNGNDFMPAPSVRFGLLGTWKYNEDVKAMVGYSYRYETYGYDSNSSLGARNSAEYAGHFLNFAVEFGLSKQKFK